MPKASLHTLGCKLNQFETNYMASLLENMGYELARFPSVADVYLINTCTVTLKSETHSRQAVRRAIKQNPEGIIIVTGCAAQVNPEGFVSMHGVDLVLGNREKMALSLFLNKFQKGKCSRAEVSDYNIDKNMSLFPMLIERFSDYTRAFIKVQEGCDAHCTYCIVPKARGPARSIPIEMVAAQADLLWASGYKEIVLTGIHLGQYGKDMNPKKDLGELLNLLLVNIGKNRLRLSSIEPNEINKNILNCVGSSSRLCPHFHIPLQSGSEKILSRMGRSYTSDNYTDVIHDILRRNPMSSIGADVMVGFPGEDEEDFGMTCKLIEALPLAYLHVFSFSPRPGTPAASMSKQIDALEKKRRSLFLRKMGQCKKESFRYRFLNKEIEALVLNQVGPEPDYRIALTENYIPVYVKAKLSNLNRLALIKIEKIDKKGIRGRIRTILN